MYMFTAYAHNPIQQKQVQEALGLRGRAASSLQCSPASVCGQHPARCVLSKSLWRGYGLRRAAFLGALAQKTKESYTTRTKKKENKRGTTSNTFKHEGASLRSKPSGGSWRAFHEFVKVANSWHS